MNTEKQNKEIDSWIAQYLLGKSDKESQEKLKTWSRESETNRQYVRNQLELWFSSEVAGSTVPFDKDKAFNLFRQRIENSGKPKKRVHPFSWKTVYRVAAVILILVLPLVAYWKGQETIKGTFADVVIESPMGAQVKLHLPDGTLVWLNAGSTIVYSQGFGVDDRRLSLEGEGYFEVTRNEKIPFEINTKEVNLKVLGTKFNFKNYPEDSEVTVNLIEGKVALYNELKVMPELYLEPNEKMVLDKQTGEMSKSKTNTAFIQKSWTNDELFFDEEMLEEIAKKLMRSYNVKIKVDDSLKCKPFYGNFKKSENTVEDILKAISSTGRLRYKYENKVYVLY